MATNKPLDELTPEQKKRLEALEVDIQFEKVTVGFSIEDRDPDGRKKWALNSVTVGRKGDDPNGWSPQEIGIVTCLLSKHVVRMTYRDAAKRRIMPSAEAAEEVQIIAASYDVNLAKLLKG